jgi:mRNA interferase RelE/StbE
VTHKVRYQPSAQRDLSRLPLKVVEAAVEFIEGVLAESPWRVGKPLHEPFEGLWSARRLDYRIVFSLNDEEIVIEIVRVAYRADAYRPRG